ncbi:FAS1 domain [Macleaya cordata]|uniref:FAS1 domain n=1 Tax=Macleaya cordata TaxID=56857 RepID=A0A200PMQ9_MACCD|nr:FAS1 domain [Macleaya cordata]
MAASQIFSLLPLLLISFSLLSTPSFSHNITEMLSGTPDYSLYNDYLSRTKLADEINSRQTITCLVLNNAAMSSLAGNHPLSVIKKALSLLVLLDYYDAQKLHDISKGNAPGNLGFVNITDLKGGKVGFGSAAPGSKLDSSYTKSVKQIPYNISVLEISAPIMAPGILSAPAPSVSDVNITALLEKAGCKIFASLITSSGVLKIYQSEVKNGLTVFAPSDEAFKAPGLPDLSKLTNAEVVTILQYHAIGDYTPIGTLKTSKDPIRTLAGKYTLTVTTAGDSVTLNTGVDASRVSGTVIDDTPLVIFTIDSILLPSELFGKSPSPAPAPGPVSSSPSPSPSPASVSSPSPAPEIASAPSPFTASPPAPPSELTPGGAPADSPAAADSTAGNGAVDVRAPALLKTLVAVSAAVLAWSL